MQFIFINVRSPMTPYTIRLVLGVQNRGIWLYKKHISLSITISYLTNMNTARITNLLAAIVRQHPLLRGLEQRSGN